MDRTEFLGSWATVCRRSALPLVGVLPQIEGRPGVLGDLQAAADVVAAAQQSLTDAQAARDRLIRAAHEDGVPVADICARAKVSRARVYQVIA